MSEQYVINLEYGSSGLPYVELFDKANLTAETHGTAITICGNTDGLLFLAHQLVALAKMPVDSLKGGYHIHLDDLYGLNPHKIEFVLRRDLA
ncbi:MAG: Imm32 family immunity protein [Candidatus Promineifilaceae bacterium]